MYIYLSHTILLLIFVNISHKSYKDRRMDISANKYFLKWSNKIITERQYYFSINLVLSLSVFSLRIFLVILKLYYFSQMFILICILLNSWEYPLYRLWILSVNLACFLGAFWVLENILQLHGSLSIFVLWYSNIRVSQNINHPEICFCYSIIEDLILSSLIM